LNNVSSVRDNNDGTYTVRYFLPFTDTFRLDVSLYGERYCHHPPHTHTHAHAPPHD
jgi:hypothetical protein